MRKRLFAFTIAILVAGGLVAGSPQVATGESVDSARIEAIFSRWTTATPGCAVGVSVGGRSVLESAYGMADLEHEVRNKPDTIFEAGSVSKQFTAAAILLLAADGKLSLDDRSASTCRSCPTTARR
jgi:CubicO group peptidase (beta-lactamase class C family)